MLRIQMIFLPAISQNELGHGLEKFVQSVTGKIFTSCMVLSDQSTCSPEMSQTFTSELRDKSLKIRFCYYILRQFLRISYNRCMIRQETSTQPTTSWG